MGSAAWYHHAACRNHVQEQCLPSEWWLKSPVWQSRFTSTWDSTETTYKLTFPQVCPSWNNKIHAPKKSGFEQVEFSDLFWFLRCFMPTATKKAFSLNPSYLDNNVLIWGRWLIIVKQTVMRKLILSPLFCPQGAICRTGLVWVEHCSWYSVFSTKLYRW